MKHKKTLVAILLCFVLIFSAISLVACGDNDGNNGDNIPNAPELDPLSESALGYFLINAQSYEYCELSFFDYSNIYDATDLDSDYGESSSLGIWCNHELSDNNNDDTFCMIYVFDSEIIATESLPLIQETEAEYNVHQENNMIITQSEEGLYNSIIQTKIPSCILSDNALNFIKSNIALGCPDDAKYASSLVGYGCDEGFIFSKNSESLIGNCNESLLYTSDPNHEYITSTLPAMNNEMFYHAYTSNSYVKQEQDGGYLYLKSKPGFVFEKTNDSYAVVGYFYNTENGKNAIIPSQYNGKAVTSIKSHAIDSDIQSIVIPASITTIEQSAICFCYSLETIYCEAQSQPAGWDTYWINSCPKAEIVWGYNG